MQINEYFVFYKKLHAFKLVYKCVFINLCGSKKTCYLHIYEYVCVNSYFEITFQYHIKNKSFTNFLGFSHNV